MDESEHTYRERDLHKLPARDSTQKSPSEDRYHFTLLLLTSFPNTAYNTLSSNHCHLPLIPLFGLFLHLVSRACVEPACDATAACSCFLVQ